jgi:cytochrome P450
MAAQTLAEELVLTSHTDVKAALARWDLTRNIDDERFAQGNILERVIMMLNDSEHRDRRGLENSIFRRSTLVFYENELFPKEIDHTLDRVIDSGEGDLVDIGIMLSVALSARTAGVDFDVGSLEQRRVLANMIRRLARGVSIDAATGDVEEIKRDVRDALRLLEEFIGPSWERRRRKVDDLQAGRAGEDDLPHDILTLLLRHRAALGLDDATILRETAFFLESGVGSNGQTLTSCLHYLFGWAREHPDDWKSLRGDRLFLQRCLHEAIRLRPPNPRIKRRALLATRIGSKDVPAEQQIVLNTAAANRDPSIYGDDAEVFNPYRVVPASAARYGHGFGGGIHACIGRVLASGLPIRFDGPAPNDHQFGLVTLLAEALFERGVSPHPSKEPVSEPNPRRWTRWSAYPVVFRRSPV